MAKTRKTRKQKKKRNRRNEYRRFIESSYQTTDRLTFEATIEAKGKELTGREWSVTIMGPSSPENLISQDGRNFIMSANGRLYDTAQLEETAHSFNGIKVYDNHLTEEEYNKRQGMRSPKDEWVGTIVKPVWDKTTSSLKGILKIIDDTLASKLKNAWEAGVLGSVGLSIDTFPNITGEVAIEGKQLPVIEGFKKILSVDLVGEPAAGGGFDRIIAATQPNGEIAMEKETEDTGVDIEALKAEIIASLDERYQPVADSPSLESEEDTEDNDTADEVEELEEESADEDEESEDIMTEAKRLRFELKLERQLAAAKLSEAQQKAVRTAFDNRIAEVAEVDKMIKSVKEATAASDPTGQVNAGAAGIEVGLNSEDKYGLEFQRLIMGNEKFKALANNEDVTVKERVTEADHYNAWIKNGKPATGQYGRISSLLYDWFGGDPLISGRAFEAATTSTLATVVKNTVNIMTAADYSVRERWWEPIVTYEEVDTIDQSTLARVYGVDSLSVVNEGAAYTELGLTDEEETASFVKKGNYVGITLETLMRDKINYIRRIPTVLSNSWYNTLSDLVSGVFTVNSAAGPVLSDTGALFNATAIGTAGGHVNLLTTALGTTTAAYIAARLAMRIQTDQPLGAGRRLGIMPRYLLVPYDLEVAALNLMLSVEDPGASNAEVNPVARESTVIGVPQWTDATDWALAGDPAQYPAIYLIFPRGQRTPQLFTSDQDTQGAMFTNDELRFKVRMLTYRFSDTYDCAPVADFRPLHKSNVA